MITYKTFEIDIDRVRRLYASDDWWTYLQDDEKLVRAFHNSLYVLGAFDGEQLVGLVRCVGDGEHVVLIQDLIVLPDYRKQGIGAALMRNALEVFAGVRTVYLHTDRENAEANRLYWRLDMQGFEEVGIAGYYYVNRPKKEA